MDTKHLDKLIQDRNRVEVTWWLFSIIIKSYMTEGEECPLPMHAQSHIIKEVCKLPDDPVGPSKTDAAKAVKEFLAKKKK